MQTLKLQKLSIQELSVLNINWLKQNVSILFVRVLLGSFIWKFLNIENYGFWHLGIGGFLIWDSGRLDCWMGGLQDFELLDSEFLYSGFQDVGFRVWGFLEFGFLDLGFVNLGFWIWDLWIVELGILWILEVQIWRAEPKRVGPGTPGGRTGKPGGGDHTGLCP